MQLQSVLVYRRQSYSWEPLVQKLYQSSHVDNQQRVNKEVMDKVLLNSFEDGNFIPNQGIINWFNHGIPHPIIYQNLDNFGVVLIFSNSDTANKIAACQKLELIAREIKMLLRTIPLDKIHQQPEDISAILDKHLPNGDVMITSNFVMQYV